MGSSVAWEGQVHVTFRTHVHVSVIQFCQSKMKLINLECKDVITKLQAQLGLQSVDVVYDALEITKTRLKWGDHIIYFNAIDNEAEREKYKKKSEEAQIKYKTKSAVIHIPDLKVCQIIDILKADITGAYDRTCEYLRKIKPSVECPIDLLFIMNIFLHEVGHWQQLYKITD